jgi:hypothetical protein
MEVVVKHIGIYALLTDKRARTPGEERKLAHPGAVRAQEHGTPDGLSRDRQADRHVRVPGQQLQAIPAVLNGGA